MKSGREVVDLALLILALVLPSVISDVTCPSEFVAHENSCYRISPAIERIPWNAARTACNNLDGYLAEVTSQSENDFLVAQIRGSDRHFWIGGSDADVEGQWVWTNSGSLIGYTNWSPENPNNGGSVEHCLTYSVDNFMWNDLWCERKQRFICEYGPLPTTTEPPTQPPTEPPTEPSRISAAPVLPITSQLTITSALRNGFSFGEMAVTSAVLTTRLYWTIDVPAPYYSNPTVCTVYSGTSVSTSALSRIVISDACSQDQDLVGNFGNFLEDSVSRRNWALFHVFKFYDSDYITISCVVQLCRIDVDCTPSCTDRRRRSASEDPIEQMLTMTTLKVLNDKVLSNASIMGTDEERGLLKWREDAGAVVGDSDELANVYTIPRLQKYFNNLRISKYLPFCPNFNPTSGESQKHSDDAPQKIDTAFNNPCVVQHGDSVVTRL